MLVRGCPTTSQFKIEYVQTFRLKISDKILKIPQQYTELLFRSSFRGFSRLQAILFDKF